MELTVCPSEFDKLFAGTYGCKLVKVWVLGDLGVLLLETPHPSVSERGRRDEEWMSSGTSGSTYCIENLTPWTPTPHIYWAKDFTMSSLGAAGIFDVTDKVSLPLATSLSHNSIASLRCFSL